MENIEDDIPGEKPMSADQSRPDYETVMRNAHRMRAEHMRASLRWLLRKIWPKADPVAPAPAPVAEI